MGNKKPISRDQRKIIGGMWADIDQSDGSNTIACEMRFYANVPADDHNPAELICKQLAAAFEEQAKRLRILERAYFDPKAVPTMTVEQLDAMQSLKEQPPVEAVEEELPGENPPATDEAVN